MWREPVKPCSNIITVITLTLTSVAVSQDKNDLCWMAGRLQLKVLR